MIENEQKKNVNFAWYLRPDSGIFIIHVTSKYPACATAEAVKQTDNTQILGCMFFVLFFMFTVVKLVQNMNL